MGDLVIMPRSNVSARVVLAQAIDEVKEGDVTFVIILSGEEAHILSSAFKTRDISWAAQILNGNALNYAMKE